MHSIRAAALFVALATTACTGGTAPPSAVPTGPPAATASPTARTGTTFVSSIHPYSIELPYGWQAGPHGSGEDFFFGLQDMTLTVGSGEPEPGQTVEDRVAANRLEFPNCTTDPASDAPVTVAGAPGILWSIHCGATLGLAANTIHNGVGYRLLIQLPDGAAAMAQATALMDSFLASFAFTD